jgi:hypothetical protein
MIQTGCSDRSRRTRRIEAFGGGAAGITMTLAQSALAKLAQAGKILQRRLHRAVRVRLSGLIFWLGNILITPILPLARKLPMRRHRRAPVCPLGEQARSERAAATARNPDTEPKLQKRARGSPISRRRARGDDRKRIPATAIGRAAASSGNSTGIDRNPCPARTDLTMDGSNRRPPCAAAKAENLIRVEVDKLAGQGLLQPGARRVGVMHLCGGTFSADCEADMVDPANAWLRLRFCTRCPPNGYRRVVDQRLALVADGSRWRFLDRGELCDQLVLRAGRFGRPRRTVPRPPRPPRPSRPPAPRHLAHGRNTRVAGQIWLQIDELIEKGHLQPGAIRRGVMSWWHPGAGARTAAVAYQADMVDRTNATLRLQFWNRDRKTGRERRVEQQLVLAKGGGGWWFLVAGQIHERLGLRRGGIKFGPPQPVGPRREACRQHTQNKNDVLEAGSWSRARAARRLTKLAKAKSAIEQFLVGIFDRSLWQAGILPIVHAALSRITATWQHSEQKTGRLLQSLIGAIVRLGSRFGVLDPRGPAV